ncbi:PREDICTED: alpha-ketoglutarate-dependent dioxygenase alkB homolog 4-like [Branchiostoma belcheri]|uniref:Alpha-ketoglutarate-dependent dioxygenase alkB homolog 4-like n=1 Tax=Branchiostoma belcheri TaxID=7741 RepID=A0A6P4YRU6_BRABE|nr:PREDICTED: alpha-ketoglutarate-dependent dioxygenase alkB homolog 4-like [Branchiostoma belcheri]
MESRGDDFAKKCGCKGIRTCLLCEEEKATVNGSEGNAGRLVRYMYCHQCHKAWRHTEGSLCQTEQIDFPGVLIVEDFITPEEETEIVTVIEGTEWKMSQSGRKKQDFGPKVNFKKKKLKLGGFTGLPSFSASLLARMKSHDLLKDFTPVEQCHLEYDPSRGSAIDPHFDDFWLWGERLVTVNLLADSVLTMSCEETDKIELTTQQTTHCEHGKKSVPSPDCDPGSQTKAVADPQDMTRSQDKSESNILRYCDVEVAIPMPRRSLIVVHGDARHKWMHAIHREDITSRRIAVTLRELSSEFSAEGVLNQTGKELIDIALSFNGSAIS